MDEESGALNSVIHRSNDERHEGSDVRHRKLNDNCDTSEQHLYGPDPDDADGRKSVLLGVAGYILITEFCERLAYYGFAGSLVLFFQTQLGYSNAEADVQYSAWSGFCYVSPLLGGYIADTYLGRYWTILIFCSIYLVGLVLVVFGSIPGEVTPAVFFPAIYIVAIGTGGIKPNVSTMGADQFDDKYSKDRKEKESFFNWFYWSINLGSLISYVLVAYVCQYGIPSLGGQKWGFFVGYCIPAIAMVLAILVFVLGTPKYRHQKPQGSVLATAVKICFESVWSNRFASNTRHVLDRAKTANGGSFSSAQVESVKLVTRLAPFLLVMVPYWGIYSQMSTVFQNQGCQMNLSMGEVQIPVSALNAFDTIAILLLVPVFDKFLYPYLNSRGYPMSMLQKMGWGFLFALLSMLMAAFIEIYRRGEAPPPGDYYDTSARANMTPCQNLDDYNPYKYSEWYSGTGGSDLTQPLNCHQSCGDTFAVGPVTYLNMTCIACDNIPQISTGVSVFWQVFQFMLVGTSEIFASVAALEFFYSQAPVSMRSMTSSLNMLTNAIGTFAVIPILLIVNSDSNNMWVPENLDEGHLDYYFFLLAALMGGNLVSSILFYYLARGYEYKSPHELVALDRDATNEAGNEETAALTRSSQHGSSSDSGGSCTNSEDALKHGSGNSNSSRVDDEGQQAYNPLNASGGCNSGDEGRLHEREERLLTAAADENRRLSKEEKEDYSE